MKNKAVKNEVPARRKPRQARAQDKIELMFEAAIRLLDTGDLSSLTTNAVAAKAGVSIGTLYQYFEDKEALLDALVGREMAGLSEKILSALKSSPGLAPGDRVRRIVHVVVKAYGGRGRVHRLLLERAMTLAPGRRLSPLYERLTMLFEVQGVGEPDQTPRKMSKAQAFVLMHATAGVLRTLAATSSAPPIVEVEDALVLLILRFVSGVEANDGKAEVQRVKKLDQPLE